ncbi:MAG: O-antigen ligase family protein, partial [Actinomycetota bacterium]|nr:O-antigen ligase family protein [Actinomycetota bacterium]
LAGAGVLLVALVVATPLAGRLADVAAPGGTGRGRVDEWSAAAGVIRDRPVVGVGPEGYRVAVTRHLDEGYASRNGRGDVVDRAHSAPLDVAATAGLPAAAGYVALVGLVARAAIGLNRRRPGTLVAAVGAGTVGFFAAQLVLFPVPELDAVAWLAAGAVLAAAGPTPGRGPEQRWPPVAAVAAAVGLVVIAAVVGWRGVSADRSLRTAADLAAEGRRGDALAAAGRAVDAGIVDIDATYLAAGIARSGPTILDLDLAIDLTEHGLTGAPGDPALRTLHLELLVERAARSGLPDDLGRVDDAAAALAADDPTNPALCAAAGLDVLRSRPAGDGTVRAAGGCTPR